MIYATLLRRYLLPLIGYSILAALLVVVCVWNFEGFLPVLSFGVFLGVVLFCIPVLIYIDYKEVKGHIRSLNDVRKGGAVPADYVEKTIALAAEKTGVPEFVVSYFFRRAAVISNIKQLQE